jgi:cytochrome c biogenesis protein CcdA
MMSHLYAASDALGQGALLAMPVVLVAGVLAGLNPCCVALYPAAAALYCGTKSSDACCGPDATLKGRGLRRPVAFVLGIAAATTTLGVIAALAGQVVGQPGAGFRYAIAVVPLIMGLHLIGWLRLPVGTLPHRVVQNSWLSAFGGGFLLSLALTPCGTPVLASVLSYAAYKGSVGQGAILLFLYGVGSGIPVVLVGTTAGRLTARLEKSGYGLWAERISATALLALGLFLVWRA